MKKPLLFILSLFVAHAGLAQSFSIPMPTYTHWTAPNSNLISVGIPITNTSSNKLDVIVEKTGNNLALHHSSLFCFGIACYDTSTLASGALDFPSQATETLLADLNCNYTLGVSCVTYRIYDVNNIQDYADVQVCYNVTATGINDIAASASISLPNPNPADRIATVSYSLARNSQNYQLQIFNVLGNKVREIPFTQNNGILLLPVSELKSGVYFYSLMENGKVISTHKLVVAHKN